MLFNACGIAFSSGPSSHCFTDARMQKPEVGLHQGREGRKRPSGGGRQTDHHRKAVKSSMESLAQVKLPSSPPPAEIHKSSKGGRANMRPTGISHDLLMLMKVWHTMTRWWWWRGGEEGREEKTAGKG